MEVGAAARLSEEEKCVRASWVARDDQIGGGSLSLIEWIPVRGRCELHCLMLGGMEHSWVAMSQLNNRDCDRVREWWQPKH